MRLNKKAWGILVVVFLLSILSVKGSSEVPIVEELHNQFHPAIYENYMVWEDDRDGNLNIYGYNIEEGEDFQITTNSKDQLLPAIHQDIVVWQDNRTGNWDIYWCNILTKKPLPIAKDADDQESPVRGDQVAPAIYENIVVWQDNRNGHWDIYGYSFLTDQEFRITTSTHDQQFPSIYGDIVVWMDNRNDNWDIYGYDIAGSREFQITANPYSQQFPAIYGELQKDSSTYTVVWMDWRDGNWNIYARELQWDENNGYGLSKEEKEGKKEEAFPITTNPNQQRSPAIYGNVVVWYDDRNCCNTTVEWDIYGVGLQTGQEFQISVSEHDQRFPAIYKDIVVWMDNRKCNWDIYHYKIPQTPEISKRTSYPSCPDQKSPYLAYIIVPLSLITVILSVYRIAKKYPTKACEHGPINSPEEKMEPPQVHWVNALRDPLSNLLIGRWKVFFAILLLFVALLVLTSFYYGTLTEIDINSLPRGKVVLLYEEAFSRPMLKDPTFILIFLIPTLVFYPAKRFFCYIPKVFKDLFDDGIITKRGCTHEEVMTDLNGSLKDFEKKINEKYMYLPGFFLSFFGIFAYLINIQNESPGFVSWRSFYFFPVNSIVQIVVEFLIFFTFGIFIWKMLCVVHCMWQLNKDYDMVLKPYDADGLGGFQPLEELWLRMSYMAIPVLTIPIMLFLLNHYFGTAFNPFSTSVLCSTVVVVLLVIPVLNYHHIVETRKTSFLEDIEKKIERHQKRMEGDLLGEERDLEDQYMKEIERLQKVVFKVKGIPSMPFKQYQKAYILLSALIPWIMGIISYFT